MTKVSVYDIQGKVTGEEIELSPEIFGLEPNKTLLHKAVVTYLSNQRQGTHFAKRRSEITGSTKKLFRQKGTGNARKGNIKSPVLKGGGKTFAPHPRDYTKKMNKKEKVLARFSAYSDKALSDSIFVFDNFDMEEPKTSKFASILNGMGVYGKKVLVIVDSYSWYDEDEHYEKQVKILKSAKNIKNINYQIIDSVNTYEIMNADYLVFQKAALETLNRVGE